MISTIPNKVINEFDRNLADWYLGGPKSGGWTRNGSSITPVNASIISFSYGTVSVDEALAKNRAETFRWHLAFLQDHSSPRSTAYYLEYLATRYDVEKADEQVYSFLALLDDIVLHGVRKAVWVADVTTLGMGFRFFRFDGCHRLCCAKHLGIEEVPALIFKVQRRLNDDVL